jgi:NAD(P)-dependent dehydrogenase (short-subunit alcohol dehydrogenase family)
MPRTLVTFGAGPGIGNHVSAVFAAQGPIDHIVLLSRNEARLSTTDAPFVRAAAPNAKVSVLRIDLADTDSLAGVLAQLDELTAGDDVEVVFFNAAVVQPRETALSASMQDLEYDLKTTTLALYAVAQHYIPRLQSLASSRDRKPALLVTNSHLPWDPIPQLLPLSLVKAAQRNMVQSFAKAYGESGVHCGLLTIEGVVDPGNKVLNPQNIAENAWAFWDKGKGLEVRLKEE